MAIVIEQAGSEETCSSCGESAVAKVRFQGPGANRKAKVMLCKACRGLMGHMLAEETEQAEPLRYVV
jgi:hypothetical protein